MITGRNDLYGAVSARDHETRDRGGAAGEVLALGYGVVAASAQEAASRV